MVKIAPWKVYMTLAVCVLGVLYAMPNVIGEDMRSKMTDVLPSWAPQKTINLGLDLRGGAHLLYEVEISKAVKDRIENLEQDIRKSLREEKLGYKRIGTIENGVRVTLRGQADGDTVRKLIRKTGQNLDVSSDDTGLIVNAVFTSEGVEQIYDHALSQSIEVVRRRIDALGTTEPVIQRQGEDRILIQAPGADAEELKAIVGTTAQLTFHLVADPSARSLGTKTLPMTEEEGGSPISIEGRPLITGEMLDNAQYAQTQGGEHAISFRLNSTGARRFCDVTRANVGRPFAIVLDNEVISAPVIREAICGGQGQISGSFTVQSANDLALLLRAGALPAPMYVVEERTVGPSLGADSVEAGKIAAMVGMALVLVFMMLHYSAFGLMANVALLVNVALIFALLSMMQATLTLPGIAGIVLTIGMAVDANVLIFERIREELRLGRTVISAIDAGYSRAMSTIIDSNLTTLIAALILFSFGTGPIKGFSVTLMVGIVTSFFTAVMVTRLLVLVWLKKNRNAKELPI
ncbi:MAG: protein translocase subunit SecD [Micavibrio sp.]|nr:protein translocase subunit SecD [Micavibrio sp.]